MNICVYAASSERVAPVYLEAAEELGRLLAVRGHTLVFGGGQDGLMGACARGAAKGGGEIIGIAPRFFDEPGVLFPGCTQFLYTDTMRERKQLMEERSQAFLVLPGGIGTFEEFLETLTLKQLGRHGKPMALISTRDYYEPLLHMLRAAAEGGFLGRGCLGLFGCFPTPEEALRYVETAPERCGGIKRLQDYGK